MPFSCPIGFTGLNCQTRSRSFRWQSWLLTILACVLLSLLAYTSFIYGFRRIRLKYLFAHHRLHEHIGLEVNSTGTGYTPVPSNDRPSSLDNRVFHENDLFISDTAHTSHPDPTADEFADDPFFVDDKQPIFRNDGYSPIRAKLPSTDSDVF